MKLKTVTIVVSLVEESVNVATDSIEEEIMKELSQRLSLIPWAKEIKRVTVE